MRTRDSQPQGDTKTSRLWKFLRTLPGVITFVSTVLGGVVALLFLIRDGEPPPPDPVNVQYLADLVKQGPFTESLPGPLQAGELVDIQVGGGGSQNQLEAVELEITVDADPAPATNILAHIEIYPTPEDAAERHSLSQGEISRRYGDGGVVDDEGCLHAQGVSWICLGAREYAYAEVTLNPSNNANRSLAIEILRR